MKDYRWKYNKEKNSVSLKNEVHFNGIGKAKSLIKFTEMDLHKEF